MVRENDKKIAVIVGVEKEVSDSLSSSLGTFLKDTF